jgi:hypothetical protein
MNASTLWTRILPAIGALLALIAAGGAVVGLVALVQWLGKNTRMEVTLPSLVIVGVLVIVLSLGLMAVAFSFTNMTDRTQALGLPDGSVRAVVALLLVVLFAILSISLYTGLSEGTVDSISQLSAPQKDALIAKMVPSEIVSVSDPTKTDPPTYTVWHRSPASVPSQDFAKQLLVMIGTLVTAVASFYFGTSSVASAQAAAARGSSGNVGIHTLAPTTIPRGSRQTVTISGENLGAITAVTLSNGLTKVSGTNVLSNAGTVKFDVALDPTAPTGDWDVTISDAAGAQTKSPVRLTVTGT